MHFSAATLRNAAAGDAMHVPSWPVVCTYVSACGADPVDLYPLWKAACASRHPQFPARAVDREMEKLLVQRAAAPSVKGSESFAKKPRSGGRIRRVIASWSARDGHPRADVLNLWPFLQVSLRGA